MTRVAVLGVSILCCVGSRGEELPERAKKIVEKTTKALVAEAERHEKLGQLEAAKVVTGAVADLEQKVLVRRDSPEAYKLRQSLFTKSIHGEWVRTNFDDKYFCSSDGTMTAIGPKGNTTNRARFQRYLSDSCVEYRWDSGHVWRMQAAGPRLLAVVEYYGENRVGDGVVLERK